MSELPGLTSQELMAAAVQIGKYVPVIMEPKPKPLEGEQAQRLQEFVTWMNENNFIQGQGCLRNDDRWCCLGLMCEFFRIKTGLGKWVPFQESGNAEYDVFEVADPGFNTPYRESHYLPAPVRQWYGLTSNPQIGNVNGLASHAAPVNDGGATFPEIGAAFLNMYISR